MILGHLGWSVGFDSVPRTSVKVKPCYRLSVTITMCKGIYSAWIVLKHCQSLCLSVMELFKFFED